MPNHSKQEDRFGKRVPYSKKAHTIADFLANAQWAEPPAREWQPRPPIIRPEANDCKTAPFILTELQLFRHIAKKNKAPGPDGITTEQTHQHLINKNQTLLLQLIKRGVDNNMGEGLELTNINSIFMT